MALTGYGNQSDTRAYANEVGPMEPETPLTMRLESILGRLTSTLRIFEELQHGPQPEQGGSNLTPAIAGVLNLGSECDKVAAAVENQAMIIAKRIGRL